MNAMKRVGEIMIPVAQYPSVRDNTTLRNAIKVIVGAVLEVDLRKSLPRVLLVFDGIDVLVGTIGRRDIMRGLEPSFLVSQPLEYRKRLFEVAVDPNLAEFSYDRVIKGIKAQAERPVSEVMRPIKATLDAEDHVGKAIYEMVSLNVSLIPVLRGRKVVGVVRSVDVFNELAELLS
jgi:predicted transcriptional regulator